MSEEGERKPRIFLCHASEDKPRVRELYQQLKAAGYNPWLDKYDLLPGQDWRQEIEKIVSDSHNIVVVFLSGKSINKRGVVQKEIKRALDVLDETPEDTIYLIPARLEPCQVPSRLSRLHRVDLFEPDGFEKLQQALDFEISQRQALSQPASTPTEDKAEPHAVITGDREQTASSPDWKWYTGLVMTILGLIVALLSCIAAWLALPPTYKDWFYGNETSEQRNGTPSPTSEREPISISTSILTSFLEGHIVFTSTRDGNPEIYVMNADGTGQKRLTSLRATDVNAEISPDGKRVAIGAYHNDSVLQIYVMNVGDSNLTHLMSIQDGHGWPFWSSDGERILYMSNTAINGSTQLYSINVDGTEQAYLADLGVQLVLKEVSLSPDGQSLLIERIIDDENHTEFFSIGIDGTGLTQLTNRETYTYHPAWSPDGSRIAFASGEIWVMNADGTGATRLPTGHSAWSPGWSPDGQRIVFNRDENIFVIHPDGTELIQITYTGSDHASSWGP